MLPRRFTARDYVVQGLAWTAGPLAALVCCLTVAVHAFGTEDHARSSGAIVVLGARVRPDGTPSPALVRRTLAAVSLYDRGFAPRLVLTGGRDGGGVAQGDVEKRIAMSRGVPGAACIVDAHSRNTAENAREAVKLMRTAGVVDAIVVSDGYHLMRARQQFRRQGVEVVTSPAPAGEKASKQLFWTLREVVAMLASPGLLVRGAPTVR